MYEYIRENMMRSMLCLEDAMDDLEKLNSDTSEAMAVILNLLESFDEAEKQIKEISERKHAAWLRSQEQDEEDYRE
jgi:hypothetical protein